MSHIEKSLDIYYWDCSMCRFNNKTKKLLMIENSRIECEKCEETFKIIKRKEITLDSLLNEIQNNEIQNNEIQNENVENLFEKMSIKENENTNMDTKTNMDTGIEDEEIDLSILDKVSNIMKHDIETNITTYMWYFYDNLGNFYYLENKFGIYNTVNRDFSFWSIANYKTSQPIKTVDLQKFLRGDSIMFNGTKIDISMLYTTSENYKKQHVIINKVKQVIGEHNSCVMYEYTWYSNNNIKLTIHKYLPKITLIKNTIVKDINEEELFDNLKMFKKIFEKKVKLPIIYEELVPVQEQEQESVVQESVRQESDIYKVEKYSDIPKGNLYINFPKKKRIAYQMGIPTTFLQYKNETKFKFPTIEEEFII
jgi:hypothetical protein